MFDAQQTHGVVGRAQRESSISVQCINPRDFTEDRHRTVDDRPYGGGPGMLMMIEPLRKAIASAKQQVANAKVIYMSPQGRVLDHGGVCELAQQDALIILAGRYEGVDERLLAREIDEEWSIGDYVLSGGELPAMVLIDSVARQLPGVLGHPLSAEEDSFAGGLLDCPHYTRPESHDYGSVPAVLMSGNHAAIKKWRLQQSLLRTWQRRPELLRQRKLSPEEKVLLDEVVPDNNL